MKLLTATAAWYWPLADTATACHCACGATVGAHVDPKSEDEQVERLKAFKENRDQDELNAKLEELRETAQGTGNLLHPIRAALKANASIGEVCGVMRDEFGEYQEA